MPVDLVGWCFNCFSASHFAAQWRQKPRCFRCREPGHRSIACPARRGNNGYSNNLNVWRSLARDKILAVASSSRLRSSSQRTATAARKLNRSVDSKVFINEVWRWKKTSHMQVEADASRPRPSPSLRATTTAGGDRRTPARRRVRSCVHETDVDHGRGRPLLVSPRAVGWSLGRHETCSSFDDDCCRSLGPNPLRSGLVRLDDKGGGGPAPGGRGFCYHR